MIPLPLAHRKVGGWRDLVGAELQKAKWGSKGVLGGSSSVTGVSLYSKLIKQRVPLTLFLWTKLAWRQKQANQSLYQELSSIHYCILAPGYHLHITRSSFVQFNTWTRKKRKDLKSCNCCTTTSCCRISHFQSSSILGYSVPNPDKS